MTFERSRRYVATAGDLGELVLSLERATEVALDSEANSFHVYRERVCLIQLSTRDADWAVDPLAVDVGPLGAVLANPAVEVVAHGADYDVRCLKRDFGFRIARLFDTMLAAKVAGRKELGLAALLKEQFGVHLAKGNQISDWGRRPLSAQQLEYAWADTRFLLPLRDLLHADLVRLGKVDLAREQFAKQAACEPRPKQFDPEGWRRIRAVRALEPAGQAVARALWLLREECARETDRPPFKVFGDDAILAMAKNPPRSEAELAKTKGIGESTRRRHGEAILSAVARALAVP